MNRLETAYRHSDVASGGSAAESHASHASDVHVSTTTTGSLSDSSTQPTKYDKTAVILLGWKPEYCDTGVAPEVSSHTQLAFKIIC
jgi:hypothetical protein